MRNPSAVAPAFPIGSIQRGFLADGRMAKQWRRHRPLFCSTSGPLDILQVRVCPLGPLIPINWERVA
jgi:hypothetical protein